MPRRLGELEDAVMTRVWEWNRPVTVRDVLEDLRQQRSIAYTTVMTVLDNLRRKGWVRRHQDGRAYRYEAVSTRAVYAAAMMHEAWAESDNPAAALVAFFDMMAPEQNEALRDALRVADLSGGVPPPAPADEDPEPREPGEAGTPEAGEPPPTGPVAASGAPAESGSADAAGAAATGPPDGGTAEESGPPPSGPTAGGTQESG